MESQKISESAVCEQIDGLTSEEVREQTALGHVNVVKEKVGKSYPRIIFDNLFTPFNLVWAIVVVVLILFKSYSNLAFLPIIITNIAIAIFSEIKAKRTVEKLSVTTETKATVIRDGRECEIKITEIVLGDVIKIELGKQVVADAVVISGLAEANESLLTGEADAIKKSEGDTVLAGSFLVSGAILAKVIRVGKDTYVHRIESAAKSFKTPASNLFRDLDKLIKYIGIFMVPMTAATFLVNRFAVGYDLSTSVIKTSGSVIGMIPAGAYLLVTLTLTMSVIKLSKKKTLVQDMYSIEMLASADVVCLDKTGTITDGTMCVTECKPLGGSSDEEIRRIMALVEGAEESINNTSRALIGYFGTESAVILEKIPFSSARKYSAVSIEGVGTFAIGAPGFVPCPVSKELEGEISRHAQNGERVLILARLESLDEMGVAIAMIAISDTIRPAAAETIGKFQEQGVTVKIISGDHAETVSTIAARVGVKNADRFLSCDGITDEELVAAAEKYAIFGRVTPEQKVLLVKTLQSNGHVVAMTGDGVNDTLALKESNCAIAMADGSEVARKVSQIVLLESDFNTLPDVVREGRRCINNVRASSTLFLMKTVFTVLLSVFAVGTISGYPFEPKQFMLIEMFVIGLASFLLALEPNDKRVEGSFLRAVLIKSSLYAFAIFVPTLIVMLIHRYNVVAMSMEARNSIAMLTVTLVGFINLLALCRPYTRWRVGVCCAVGIGLIGFAVDSVYVGNVVPFIPSDMLYIIPAFENPVVLFSLLATAAVFSILLHAFLPKIEAAIYRLDSRIAKKRAKLKGSLK
jgi:cation-transporting ATPase E